MQRTTRRNHPTIFLGAAFYAALVFLAPTSTQAAVLPEKITFQTGDFVQIIEGDELSDWFEITQAIAFHPPHLSEIGSTVVCPFPALVCEAFLPRHVRTHLSFQRMPMWKTDAIRMTIEGLAEKVDREPENARLGVQDGKVIVTKEAVPGRLLEVDKTFDALQSRLKENENSAVTLTLVTSSQAPKVTAETIETLGIKELISEGKTNFSGSPKNRIFNIKRALEQYDGAIIAPDEEFSFVKLLGEVDGEHGYLPELVIKYNRTEPEFGGGICQVSTTVFRAALNAGLKITARKNHAYPVQYYKPYGMDATIYIPNPDLRFKNNTPGSILIIPSVNGTELTFSFYGTKDGRSVTLDGPYILERNPDGSMKTIFTQIVKYENGNTFIEDTFPSSYKSPSLFPHPGDDPIYTEKPKGWSSRQWKEYKKLHP